MLTIINRKKEFPLYHFFGIDFNKIPLSSYLLSSDPALNLTIALRKLDKKIIVLSSEVSTADNSHDSISQKANDLEWLLDLSASAPDIKHALVYSMKELCQLINENQLIALDDQYVFFKSWPDHMSNDIDNSVFELKMNRYTPVLVFPELETSFKVGLRRLIRLEEKGAIFQIDCLSLSGLNGKRARKTAIFLMEREAVGFISLPFNKFPQVAGNDKILVSRKVADLLDKQLF